MNWPATSLWPVNSPYPVNSFLPKLKNLTYELHANTQAPVELIAPMVLGMASLVCQNSIDVRRPNCAPSSCSLYVLVIAGSGERKSTVANILSESIHDFEISKEKENRHRRIEFEANQLAWDIEYKLLLAAIEKLKKKGDSVDEQKSQLIDVLSKRPVQPMTPRLIYSDASPEVVVRGLCDAWPSAAILSDEGGSFFNGRSINNLPTWNNAWDGRGFSSDTVSAGSFSHRSPRCGIIVSVQDTPFRRFYNRRGEEAMESGFLPRFLVSCPLSTRGKNFLTNKESKWDAVKEYHERVTEILNTNAQAVEVGATDRLILDFCQAAKDRWIQMYNNVEAMAAPGQYFSDIQGYAAKVADNIARVAAIFHYFEGYTGDISLDTIERAIAVCEWHGHEFQRLFSSQPEIPIEQRDAQMLERWLVDSVFASGWLWVKKNFARQCGPNALRNKIRLENAISRLVVENKIWVTVGNNKMKIINLNMQYFNGHRDY